MPTRYISFKIQQIEEVGKRKEEEKEKEKPLIIKYVAVSRGPDAWSEDEGDNIGGNCGQGDGAQGRWLGHSLHRARGGNSVREAPGGQGQSIVGVRGEVSGNGV